MENCIQKHILSIAGETGVEAYPDHLTGFTVPKLLENIDVPKEEIIKEVNDLKKSGKLTMKSPYLTMVCPSCGSPDPFSKMVCPKCGSQNLKVEGTSVECMNCGLHTSVQEALAFMCKTCGKSFGLGSAKWITLGSLSSKGAVDVEPISRAIMDLGFYPKRCQTIMGASGVNHHYDFVFEHDGSLRAVDVRVDAKGVNISELIEFLSKVYDSGIKEAYFIAVPKLNLSIDAGKKNVKVIKAPDLKKASELLKQILTERGVSSKIVR
ncbi:MAG: hypothetical protein ACP5NC_02595 [Nitrososphaeria archaeon]